MADTKPSQDARSTKSMDFGDNKSARVGSIDLERELHDLDERRLRAQGHEAQLERSFTWLGASALAYSISNSWLTYSTCFGLVLLQGGGVTMMWTFIIAGLTQWIVFLGLGELCSALPSSGGQYHFAYVFAPERTRNFAAYVTGFINILAWWINTSSGTMYTAISLFGCVSFWFPEFAQKQYHVYLVYFGIIILSLIPIYLVPQKHLDKLTKAAMALSLVGMVMTITICLAMGRGDYAPGSIFTEFQGASGWNQGAGWLLSISTALYCFSANGAVTHIAEELPSPGRKLPQILNMAQAMGFAVGIPWTIATLFCVRDMKAVQTAFLPSVELFSQITGSKSVALFLQAFLTFLYYTAVPSQWITCSRITWAFARDHGLPFADYWQKIDEKRGIPWRTTLLSAAFCVIYGLLYIASTAAYNSIINAACLMLNMAYVIPQGILLTVGRNKLPNRSFHLGKWGYPINAFSVIFLIVIGVLYCLPQTLPTSVGSMNYNAPVISGLFAIVCLLYIERRHKFKGPTIDWELLNEVNALD